MNVCEDPDLAHREWRETRRLPDLDSFRTIV
jgi:hypothetical protein